MSDVTLGQVAPHLPSKLSVLSIFPSSPDTILFGPVYKMMQSGPSLHSLKLLRLPVAQPLRYTDDDQPVEDEAVTAERGRVLQLCAERGVTVEDVPVGDNMDGEAFMQGFIDLW